MHGGWFGPDTIKKWLKNNPIKSKNNPYEDYILYLIDYWINKENIQTPTKNDYNDFVEYFFSINKDWVLNTWFKDWLEEYGINWAIKYINSTEKYKQNLEKKRHIILDDEEIDQFYDAFKVVISPTSYVSNTFDPNNTLQIFINENNIQCDEKNKKLKKIFENEEDKFRNDKEGLKKYRFNLFFNCLLNPKYKFDIKNNNNDWVLDKFKQIIDSIIVASKNPFYDIKNTSINLDRFNSIRERIEDPVKYFKKPVNVAEKSVNEAEEPVNVAYEEPVNDSVNVSDKEPVNESDEELEEYVKGPTHFYPNLYTQETDGGGSPHIYESIKTPSFVRSAKRDKSGPYNRFHYIKVRPAPPPPLPPPRKTKKLNKII
jgi:hypothetical protein